MGFEKCLPIDDPANVWKYCPSVPAAIIFFVLFGCSTLAHIIQAVKHRRPFCFVIIMGGLWETLSFASRVISTHKPTSKVIYDASFLLLIISPLLINAFDYMLLGRMVTFFLGPDTKVGGIRGSKMGMIFVCFDVVSFIVQIGGGLLSLSKTLKTANLGLHIYTGGVVFQQLLIVCFLFLTIAFQRKLKCYGTEPSKRGARTLLHILRASLCLITYRIIFRIVEFSSSQGTKMNIYINHHEFFVYVFDAAPMFFALLIMNIWHPGKILQDDLKGTHVRVHSDDRLALQTFPPQPYVPSYPPQPYGGPRYEGA